jgi:hypothetical protein
MPITTVNNLQDDRGLITLAKYNEMQSIVGGVLDFYSVTPESVQVQSQLSLISTSTWAPLYRDINKCVVHQLGRNIAVISTPNTSTTITAAGTNQMINDLNIVSTGTSTAVVAAGQLDSTLTTATVRTLNFGSTGAIHHTVEYEWPTVLDMTSFLATGGKLTAELTWVNGTVALDSDLLDILGTASTAIGTSPYQVSYTNQTPTAYTANKGDHTITISFTKNTTKKYTIDISILSTTIQTLGGSPASSITGRTRCYRSINVGTPTGGISGPLPQSTTTARFGAGVDVPTSTFSLSASPTSLSYAFYTGDTQSATQTVTLTNNGNTAISITSISNTTAGSVTLRPIYSWTGNSTFVATTINPNGGTRTISFAYAGTNAGTFNNSITISNNSTNQPSLTIPTTQTITGFNLTPGNLTPTVTTLSAYTQQFVITNSNVSPVLGTSYTTSVTGSGFYVINSAVGPTLVFDPSGKSNGSYSTTLTVNMNGYSVSRTVALTLNIPTQTLGTWISAKAANNAVVGMSYDIIGGTRYLTIGVGTGNDGSSILSGGGSASALVANLNYAADPDPSKGLPMYESYNSYGGWVPFLKGTTETSGVGYGVTYRYHVDIPVTAQFIKRTYKFNATAGQHSFNYSVDNLGYIEISNPNTNGYDRVVDHSADGGGSWQRVTSGIWNAPTTSQYTMNIYSRNFGGRGAVAFQLFNNQTGLDVWNTNMTLRTAYQNWAEVYRIPLTSAGIYYSKDWIVKDSVMTEDGYSYGVFFEGQSMFKVVDNGTGNIAVTFNNVTAWPGPSYLDQQTVANITDLQYYYSAFNRYLNLESELPGGQTHRFDGFNASGGVLQTIVAKPSVDPYAIAPYNAPSPPYDGGGGGGGDTF